MSEKRSGQTAFKAIALISFLTALVLMILLRLSQNENVVEWYSKYVDILARYETWIESNGQTLLSFAIIITNFVIKAVIPWLPIPWLCFAAGVLFPWYYALPVNVAGCTLLFTIKYYWGKRFGGGNAIKILSKYDKAHTFIDQGKLGSLLVLFGFRFVPLMPVNSVSQLYGTTGVKYWKYLMVSLLGFSYKLFSYTIIGRNVYNPLSGSFIVPLVVLLLFTGLVTLALSGALNLKNNKNKG